MGSEGATLHGTDVRPRGRAVQGLTAPQFGVMRAGWTLSLTSLPGRSTNPWRVPSRTRSRRRCECRSAAKTSSAYAEP